MTKRWNFLSANIFCVYICTDKDIFYIDNFKNTFQSKNDVFIKKIKSEFYLHTW